MTSEPCGGVDVLADDFTNSDLATAGWYADGAPVIAGGELVIQPATNPPGGSWNALYSRHYYDLRGRAVSIEIKSMLNTATTAAAAFKVVNSHDEYVEIYQKNGSLQAAKAIPGQWTGVGTTDYDPAAHRYWRLREDSGTLYWEVSGDGVSFTNLASSSSLFDLSSVRIEFVASTQGDEVDPGEVHFDNLNGGGPPKGKWCKPSAFKDDFEDSAVGDGWARSAFDQTCEHVENGELVFTLPANSTGACEYRSASAFDLTSATLSVKVPTAPDPATTGQVNLRAFIDDGSDREIQVHAYEGHLYFREIQGATVKVINDAPLVPGEQLFWRFREDAGQLFWETSPDGMTWKTGAQAPNPFPLTALDVELSLSNWDGSNASTVEAHFDKFNMP